MKQLPPGLIPLLLIAVFAVTPVARPAADAGDVGRPDQPGVMRVLAPAPGEAGRLEAEGYDVVGARPGEWVDVLVSARQAERLRATGHELAPRLTLPREVPEYFHTYVQMLAELEACAAQHPDITRLEDVGDAWGKIYALPGYPSHDLWALKISDNPEVDEEEPVVFYIGTQHGREPAGVEICLAIIDTLTTGYGVDPQVTRFVDEHETWVVPLANPDGHWCCRTPGWQGWRKNARDNDGNGQITGPYHDEANWYWPDGVDLNRNQDWFWGTTMATQDPQGELYCGPAALSEPEAQALHDLILRERPVLLVDYHAFGELVLWPFGYDDSTRAPDDLTLAGLGAEIAARVPSWGGGWYLPEQANQVYAASGTVPDWSYGALNTFAFTIETCTWLYPGEAELAHTVAANVAGALFLQERLDGSGVRGRLTAGGAPIEGTILVEGLDDPALSAPRRSHPVLGDYYRLLSPGVYDLRFEAPGWAPVRIENVVVPPDTYVTLEVNFTEPAGCAEVAAGARAGLRLSPNPARMGRPVSFHLPEGAAARMDCAGPTGSDGDLRWAEPRIDIVDCQGRIVATLAGSSGAGGAPGGRVIVWNPGSPGAAGGAAPPPGGGVYLARLRSAGARETCRFVLLGP
jgi:carboxypeptidase T